MSLHNAAATLHTLRSADGSAIYVSPGKTHTIIVGVNYPLEVPYRSDEIPESTFIDVNLRPHNGVGMVKERHVEEVVRQTLKAIVLGDETPRTMLQVTLQLADVEIDESLPGGIKGGGQGESYLDVLCGAINAAVLGCLDAGVHLSGMAGCAVVGIRRDRTLVAWPNTKDKRRCQSLHVSAYNSQGECLLMESEGKFDIEQWEAAHTLARVLVGGDTGSKGDQEDVAMQGDDNQTIFETMSKSVETRVANDEKWRGV